MTDGLDVLATLRGSAQAISGMIEDAAGGYHDDVYLRVLGDDDDTVQFNSQSDGRRFMSYCTFRHLDVVDGDAEAIVPTGVGDAKGWLDYLSIAGGSDTVEIELLGEVDEGSDHPRLASHWRARGALETTMRLPASENDLNKVPWSFPHRWHDGQMVSSDDLDEDGNLAADDPKTMPTEIRTTAQAVREGIIDPADFLDSVNYYPITVTDGAFRVDLQGGDGDDSIRGDVMASDVDGPDVARMVDGDSDGDAPFDELFGTLSGPVTIRTAPYDGEGPAPPILVVQDDRSDRTLRHLVGAFTER